MKNANYILGLDIGNSNTVIGLFADTKDFEILHHWRIVTKADSTADELGITLTNFLASSLKLSAQNINALIYSSVVPALSTSLHNMAKGYFPQSKVSQVSWDMGLGLEFDYPRPQEIGADRIVNACAVANIYGGDAIIVDLGTATTFCVLHDGCKYIGGCICPGLKLAMAALSDNTAQLPSFEFCFPSSGILGRSTVEALQSGFFFGWTGLIGEILRRIREVDSQRKYRVIATGGLSSIIHQNIPSLFDEVDPLLTLRGLKCMYHSEKKS